MNYKKQKVRDFFRTKLRNGPAQELKQSPWDKLQTENI